MGPIDAITRPLRSADARTTTQLRATEFTHTTRVRDLAGALVSAVVGALVGALAVVLAVDFAGAFAAGFGAEATRDGGFVAARAGGAGAGAGVLLGAGARSATGAASRSGVRAIVRPLDAGARGLVDVEPGNDGGSAFGSAALARGRSGSFREGGSEGATGSMIGGIESTVSTVATGSTDDCVIESVIAATTSATASSVVSEATTAVESYCAAESITAAAESMLASASVPAETEESTEPADESGLSTASSRAFETSAGGSSCTSHAPHAMATNVAIPTPFQTYGPTGVRAGLVQHQRHSPSRSG